MKGAILSLNQIILDTDELQFEAWRNLAMYEFGMGLPGKVAHQLAGLDRHQALEVVLSDFNQTDADKDELLNEQITSTIIMLIWLLMMLTGMQKRFSRN